MIRFDSDYTEGCTPKVLDALCATNAEQSAGYGTDEHCENAKALIKKLFDTDGDVHFTVGGTQTNTIVIKAALRPHQGVIASDRGHISVHESGAIEATGHKVITLQSLDGKITADQIKDCVESHYDDPTAEHTVQPAMVYISFPTELGTLYSKAELEKIYKACKCKGIYLYIDGARLGYGLAAQDNDVAMTDIAKLCDAFYIGGTKVGLLCGEALVITNDTLKKDIRYIIKQQGGLLAKGRVLGVQFEALMSDNHYIDISENAIKTASFISDALEKKGIPLFAKTQTNQIFMIIEDKKLAEISKEFELCFWQRADDTHSVMRLCTSWATTMQDAQKFIDSL